MFVFAAAISKYVLLILMLFYTLESFVSLFKKKRKNGIWIRQELYLFMMQFIAYGTLCLRTGELDYLFYYAFSQIVLFSMINLSQMIYPSLNREISNHMAMLMGIGFIILTRLNFEKAVKQLIIAAVVIAVAMFIPFLIRRVTILKYLKWIYLVTGISMLFIVLVLGKVTYGSKISYTVAGVTIQPSEFVKILFILGIAAFLYKKRKFSTFVFSAIIAALHVLILVLSRDLGSALLFFITYMAMLLVASKNYLYLFLGVAAGGGASVIAYRLFSHVQVRVQAFRDPFSVIDKEGYQITQSLFAIGNGGIFGTGLMKGVPENIPFVESDFIFSAIAEEFGVIFSVCLLLICLFSFLNFMKTAMELNDGFYRLTAVGIAAMYIFQVFLTVGGGIKFIPLTGVTLPFVSYGGSSILVSIVFFFIMQGISLVLIDEKEWDEEVNFEEDIFDDEFEEEYDEEYEEEY